MKTGTLVNRFVLSLICFSLTSLFNGATGQTLPVTDIPDQTIDPGQSFSTISLDDYIDVPPNELHNIEWTTSGENQLSVNIDNDRNASVVPISETWTGSETITFHAMDTDLNTGSDAAMFTILQAVNAAPVVSDIPDQQYEEGEGFQAVNLDNYVTDPDHSAAELTWSTSGNSALSVNIDPDTHTALIDVPNADWNGSETIVFKATDPESESSEDQATFSLTPVNDAPVMSDIPAQTINSGELFNTIALDNYVSDVDNLNSELSWTITGNTDLMPSVDESRIASINMPSNWSGSEVLTFEVKDPSNSGDSDDATFEAMAINAAPVAVIDNYSTTQGATLNIAAPGVLSNDTDLDLDPLTAIKVADPSHGILTLNNDGSFSYAHDGTASTTDAFTYKASDGTTESNVVTVTIDITLVNVPPVLGGIEGSTLAYTEGDGPVSVTGSIIITDTDNANLESAVITISSNYQNGEDVLSFANSGGITGSWNAAGGQLTLSGSAPVASYQAALRSVKYTNNSPTPNNQTRTVSFRVSDGTDNSNTVSRNISVTALNSAPVLAAIEGSTLTYTEGDGSVNVTGTITVTDADNPTLASAVITITSNYQNGEDVLSFANTASITGSWNSTSGQMTLMGSASVSDYRSALRAVRYTNSSATPTTLTRTVNFRVNDGTDNSNTLSRNISVTALNSAPVLAAIEGTPLAYTEGTGEVIITSSIAVTDADNTNLSSALITISNNYVNGEDLLSFTNTANITGLWNPTSGQLLLSGSAPVTSYQNALRAVKYSNTDENPSTMARTVTFRVNDGTENSNTQSRAINVTALNDAPVLSAIETGALSYTEGEGPVNITGSILVADVDNANLSSAVISISANYQNGEDVLSFTNAYGLTGSWNATSGQLTLTGSATLANYRLALRSVQYTNNSTTPTILTRTVTFRVNDGAANSNSVSRNINIVAFNSAPVLDAIEVTPLPYTEGTGPVSITSTITVSDADDINLASATVTITGNYQNGEDILSFTPADGITAIWNAGSARLTLTGNSTVAQYQAALRSVKYNNTSTNPNLATRNIAFRVFDGTTNSNLENRSLSITAVNNPPVLAGIETADLAYTEGDGPVSVSGTITVTDADNLTLQSATVSISANYRNTEDILSYTPANGITGSWNGTTGVLTLTGNVSPANYQAALRAVKYTNTSGNPNITDRTVSFQVSDGTASSNVVNRNIKITRTGVFSSSIAGSASYCPSAVMPIVLTVTDGTSPFTATLTRSGSVLNRDTVITGIAASPYTINVKITGSYVLKKLTDALNEEAIVTSTPVVLAAFPKPRGVLSGPSTVCNDGQPVQLSLNLTGTSPWNFTIRRGNAIYDTTITGATSDPYPFSTRVTSSPMTVRLIAISDAHCTGDTIGSGTVRVTYLPSPAAVISGQDTICPGGTGNLKVTITGAAGPWDITYLRDGANPTTISNITVSPHTFPVTGTGNFTLSKVEQTIADGCTGRVSGTGRIVSHVVPTASISGNLTFCQYTSANLNVTLTGDSPWKFKYKLNSESPIEVLNVSASPKVLSVNKAGTYTLVEVFDKNCKGTISGSAGVTMTPAPVVSLSGLAPAYDKNYDQMVSITGTPTGGTYTGPGLFNSGNNWYFLPRYAPVGTNEIVYAYQEGTTHCYGYDTALVRVLEANAVIEFPEERLKYCQNEEPFTVTGVNLAEDIGSFTISGGTGITDHGDNTATVNPALLSVRDYTITYTYFDGTTLNVKSTFEMGKSPDADFKWESECYEPGQSIQFMDASVANFGNITAFNWKIYTSTGFDTDSTKDISYTFPKAGNHIIELQVETSNGCSASVSKVFGLRPIITPKTDGFRTETFEEGPLSWRSSNLAAPATNSWTLGTPDDPSGIHGAYSGINSWYTDLAESNYASEKSWVSSPCYDFTGMNRPMVKMSIWRDFNGLRDGAVLQATTDSAKSWFNIGQMGDGQNWFNEYTILGNPGGQQVGWSNIQDAGWIESRHALDMLKGKTRVQFRIAYGSDGTVLNTNGFAFDDFWIGERNRRVLIEHFTNTFDAASQDANDKLNAIVNEDSINTIDLQYHTSFPGNDPFNEQEPFAPSSRVLYYGISNVPYAILNGGYKQGYRFDYDSKDLDAISVRLESLNDALFTIDITESHFSNNNAIFQIQFGPKHDLTAHEYTLHAGIFERKVMGAGINGDTIYENVVRALLPDPAGITIFEDWKAIDGRTQDYSWSIPEGINPGGLMAFAFIQDEATSEVYQVNWVNIGFSTEIPGVLPGTSRVKFIVFPNPARDQAFVRFDKPVKGDVRIEMFNNLGSLVYTENISQTDTDTEIMTDRYPDGLYIIRITAGNEILGVTKLNITR